MAVQPRMESQNVEWGTKGKMILLKNSNLSNYLFAKTSASGFMVCIGGSNLFWNKSMWGQIWILKRGKKGGLHLIFIIILMHEEIREFC